MPRRTHTRYHLVKRLADVTFSSLGLVILSPVFPAVAALIRLDTRGPAIFRQTRLGRNGAPFQMYKFRSMALDSEAGGVYEKEIDPRVTRVGRVLRRTSFDELPQLWNILKGDMSFVGPRPVLTYHPWPVHEYDEFQLRRFEVRPGVTGLAQISGRKNLPWPERLRLDIQYAESISLVMDLQILGKTLTRVFSMADNWNKTSSPYEEI